MNVVIGQDIKLGTGERVIIDCGLLIDNSEVPHLSVNWYHNKLSLSNGSVPDVVISQNRRQCIITETAVPSGGQLGNGGTYTCEVCNDLNTCRSNSTTIDVCG